MKLIITKIEKIGEAGEDAPVLAEGQAHGKAEAGKEACSVKIPIRKGMRLDSRRKVMMMQRNLMKLYKRSEEQRMEFSPGPNNFPQQWSIN